MDVKISLLVLILCVIFKLISSLFSDMKITFLLNPIKQHNNEQKLPFQAQTDLATSDINPVDSKVHGGAQCVNFCLPMHALPSFKPV